jgi:phosphotransferase system enzyme I (PtsP)
MIETLQRITQQINNASDLDEVFAVVVRDIKAYLGSDACSVYLVDALGKNCILSATDGLDPRAIGSVRQVNQEGPVGLVVRRQQPVALPDSQRRGPASHRFPEYGEQIYQTFLGVPIIHYRKVLGVLAVQQINEHTFAGEDVAFLMAIAAEIAGLVHVAVTGETGVFASGGRQTLGILRGVKAAPGIGLGRSVLPSPAADIESVSDSVVGDVEAEENAFRRAVDAVRAELRASGERMAAEIPTEAHAMFRVYAALLDDDQLFADALTRIRTGTCAPAALGKSIAQHARIFEEMEDPYLRARAEDIRGLGRRVLMRLRSGDEGRTQYPEHCVLVGEEISVARIADVPIGQLAGIVCTLGSPFSHAAILARTLRIPAVVGVGNVPLGQLGGRELLVDGHQGRVFVDPSPAVIKEFQQLIRQDEQRDAELEALRDLPAETQDGVRMVLQANAGLLSDLGPALNSGAEGIGLYRTEFTFMVCDSFPGEDDQYEVYRQVVESFAPRPVTIRTLDVGGDKDLTYFPIREDNPFLGWRGIRLTLDNPGVFLIQLRAMLRANAGYGNLQILLPMISSPTEVDEVHALLDRAERELLHEGLAAARPSVGAMIEVPSTIFQMEALAHRLDYFSIGTNDLTQYLLAVDRNNARVSTHYDSLHPAVIRAVERTVRQAHNAGKPIGVCGDMAGDPASAILLLGLGVDSLSMASPRIPRVKQILRAFTRQRAQELVTKALALEDPQQVHLLLDTTIKQAGLGTSLELGPQRQ